VSPVEIVRELKGINRLVEQIMQVTQLSKEEVGKL
jgi:hypothetical protein